MGSPSCKVIHYYLGVVNLRVVSFILSCERYQIKDTRLKALGDSVVEAASHCLAIG